MNKVKSVLLNKYSLFLYGLMTSAPALATQNTSNRGWMVGAGAFAIAAIIGIVTVASNSNNDDDDDNVIVS